jgi:hypothetical protein
MLWRIFESKREDGTGRRRKLHNSYFVLPNVVVEWLTLLLRIREVLGSNLGPENGYLD